MLPVVSTPKSMLISCISLNLMGETGKLLKIKIFCSVNFSVPESNQGVLPTALSMYLCALIEKIRAHSMCWLSYCIWHKYLAFHHTYHHQTLTHSRKVEEIPVSSLLYFKPWRKCLLMFNNKLKDTFKIRKTNLWANIDIFLSSINQ